MKTKGQKLFIALAIVGLAQSSPAFEGRISATLTRGGEVMGLLYTVGTNCLRVEVTATSRPYPVDLLNLSSGDLTLLFPNNRGFVRLKPSANSSSTPPGFPPMPAMPPGVGPQTPSPSAAPAPPTIGPTHVPGMPGMPQMPNMPGPPNGLPPGVGPQSGAGVPPVSPGMAGMPAMPMMPMMMEKIELTATGDTTNLLGYECEKFEIKQRGEVMEIWATDKLLPFQPYQQNQPHRFGPRMIEEQWGDLLKARKLFPLLALLRFETPASPDGKTPPVPGPERMRFEVKSITAEKIEDKDGALFSPPAEYHELEPLPF